MEKEFKRLGLSINASEEDVKNAYRSLMHDFHPDKVQNRGTQYQTFANELTKEINESYKILINYFNYNKKQNIALENHYNHLIQLKNRASTENEYRTLAQQFRDMNAYKNTDELANECENKFRELKKDRKKREEHEKNELKRQEAKRELERKIADKAKYIEMLNGIRDKIAALDEENNLRKSAKKKECFLCGKTNSDYDFEPCYYCQKSYYEKTAQMFEQYIYHEEELENLDPFEKKQYVHKLRKSYGFTPWCTGAFQKNPPLSVPEKNQFFFEKAIQ